MAWYWWALVIGYLAIGVFGTLVVLSYSVKRGRSDSVVQWVALALFWPIAWAFGVAWALGELAAERAERAEQMRGKRMTDSSVRVEKAMSASR